VSKRNWISLRDKNFILKAKNKYSTAEFEQYMKDAFQQLHPATYSDKNLAIWGVLVPEAIRLGQDMTAKKVNLEGFSKEALNKLAVYDKRYKKSSATIPNVVSLPKSTKPKRGRPSGSSNKPKVNHQIEYLERYFNPVQIIAILKMS
jgi:hypothetical protein